MMKNEQIWDKLLRIQTSGRDDSGADKRHHPYEPTPYSVLERLADSGLIDKNDVVLDYGCGKGRVGIFLSHRTGAKTIGVEYDARIYDIAQRNCFAANQKANTSFVLDKAEAYKIPPEVNRCYFFNPFSEEILNKVMARIIKSYYDYPREILLFFYYPSDEYLSCLMAVEELDFYDEIPCDDLFEENAPRERILIFQLPGYDA